MKLLFVRIWVLVVTFCFGISVSALWRIYTLPVLPIPVVDLTARPSESLEQTQPIEDSEELRIVDAPHSCGASMGPRTYNLSDGTHITVFCQMLNSPAGARLALERRLINTTIAERTVVMGTDGNQEGEEVIITAPIVARLWQEDKMLCTTEASSLEHLRWFQKLSSH